MTEEIWRQIVPNIGGSDVHGMNDHQWWWDLSSEFTATMTIQISVDNERQYQRHVAYPLRGMCLYRWWKQIEESSCFDDLYSATAMRQFIFDWHMNHLDRRRTVVYMFVPWVGVHQTVSSGNITKITDRHARERVTRDEFNVATI